ncbi:Ionotropic receptor 25a-like 4 [Homarus americanus]|uniref:Ionotropic receptor 25a-like 4 n=1 Tax=Homarus americanus TaxID=6706 RepID=A0A8J5K8Y0_HOMAM|nr:Ionotropic receptor 25a-like 4 [Homarus americanus]
MYVADIVNYFAVGSRDTISQILDAATANICVRSEVRLVQTVAENRHAPTRLRAYQPLRSTLWHFKYFMRRHLRRGVRRMAVRTSVPEVWFSRTIPVRDDFDLRSALQSVSMTNTWAVLAGGNGMSYPDVPLTMDKFKILTRTAGTQDLGEWSLGCPVHLCSSGQTLVISRYEIAPDGKFGTMDDNHEWNGMIKQLIEKVGTLNTPRELRLLYIFDQFPTATRTTRERYKDDDEKRVQPEGVSMVCVTSLRLVGAEGRFGEGEMNSRRWSETAREEEQEMEEEEEEIMGRGDGRSIIVSMLMSGYVFIGGGEAPRLSRLMATTWWLFGFIIIASYTVTWLPS